MLAPRDIPNILSSLRLASAPGVGWLVAQEAHIYALGLFAVMAFTDALDGFLAKRYAWQSRLGGILDPLADKALLISTYVALWWLHLVPWWLLALIVGRDLVIVSGALRWHLHYGPLDAAPTHLSKLTTFIQVCLAIGLLAISVGYSPPPLVLTLGVYAVALLTLASGLHYVVIWSAKARAQRKQSP